MTSIKRRCDNSMHFARQDSKSQGRFMRPASTKQNCSDRFARDGPSELATPMFSQPASTNLNVPKVRNFQNDVDNYNLPSTPPPKFARTSIESDGRTQFVSTNKTHLGLERKRSPRIDVTESRGIYIVLIELPGVSRDDIRVEVDDTNLSVQTSNRRSRSGCLNGGICSTNHEAKILKRPFEMVWRLPLGVDPDSVSAEFLDGVLRVTIPKLGVLIS